MDAATKTAFNDFLSDAVKFHGHLCGGQVLGVRMAMAGLRELGIADSKGREGRDLVIFVEIDRCAADAIIATTGRTPGKRSVKIVDYGKMAATFFNAATNDAVRVSVRASSNEIVERLAKAHMPEKSEKAALIAAMIDIEEEDLLSVERVAIHLEPHDLPGESVYMVACEECGELVKDKREVRRDGKVLCRPCAEGKAYYTAPERVGASHCAA